APGGFHPGRWPPRLLRLARAAAVPEERRSGAARKMDAAAGRRSESTPGRRHAREATLTLPTRIQLSRRKGWRMPPDTVKVDRSTRWGNPFVVGRHGTQAECVAHYARLVGGH